MQLRQAQRRLSRIKMALQGPSGSGKTYSSLLLAQGLVGDLRKVAIIDTENSSSDLYAHLGPYNVLPLGEPFSPERYIQAMDQCEKAGIECIILDSISHCWDFLLDAHGNMVGNSFTNWAKITPRQNAFVQKILQSPAHVIATMRVKQEYVLNEKNGKQVPEKVGLKAVQRDGMDYEFTLVFDLDIQHMATCSKDRTGMFDKNPPSRISDATGQQILNWLTKGIPEEESTMEQRIGSCQSVSDLLQLYSENILNHPELGPLFTQRRHELQSLQLTKSQSNGTAAHRK